jgi:DNA repair exonuclease SbcCD ATPase subunit
MTYTHGALREHHVKVDALTRQVVQQEAALRERLAAIGAEVTAAEQRRTQRLEEIRQEIRDALAGAATEIEQRIRDAEDQAAETIAAAQEAARRQLEPLRRARALSDAAKSRAQRRRRQYDKQSEALERLIADVERRSRAIQLPPGLPCVHGGREGLAAAVKEIRQHEVEKASRN